MRAGVLLNQIRYLLNDSQKMTWSDFQLMGLLNDAVSGIYDQLTGYANSLAKKMITIKLTNGAGRLPEDFHSISGVEDGSSLLIPTSQVSVPEGCFKILGRTIYAAPDELNIEYFYTPARVSDPEEDLDVPLPLLTPLANVATSLARNDRMGADNTIYKLIMSTASRGISFVPDQRIWG